jgi:hypothetical protein
MKTFIYGDSPNYVKFYRNIHDFASISINELEKFLRLQTLLKFLIINLPR